MKRRKLLKGSALVAAGATTATALPPAAMAAPGRTSTRTGTVVTAHGVAHVAVAFDDGSAAVTVPVDGFPAGWQLRAGDRVVVTDIDGKLVAAPLVTRVTGAVRRRTGAEPGTVHVADTAVALLAATLRRPGAVEGGDYEAYFIENAHGLRPECVALRAHRHEA